MQVRSYRAGEVGKRRTYFSDSSLDGKVFFYVDFAGDVKKFFSRVVIRGLIFIFTVKRTNAFLDCRNCTGPFVPTVIGSLIRRLNCA